MKKRLIALSIIAITLMATGCKKDANVFSINATINNFSSDAKVYIDTANFSCWHSGDAIKINDITGTIDVLSNNNRKGTIASTTEPTAEDDNYYAIYPADAVTSTTVGPTAKIHLPAMQKCIIGSDGKQVINAIMGAQGTTKLNFYNLCALLKVQLPTNLNVTDIYVTTFTTDGNNARVKTNKRLWGNGTVRFNGEGARPTLTALSRSEGLVNGVVDGGDTIYLHVVNHPSDGIYYITVPEVTGVNYEVRVNYKDANGLFCHCIKRQSGNNNQLLANQIGVVNFSTITPDPDEYLPGIFSVSPTLKVNFSKGNLRYTVTDPGSNNGDYYIWEFNSNQYTSIGYNVELDGNIPVAGGTADYSRMCILTNNSHIVFPNNNGQMHGASFYDWGNFIDGDPNDQHWFTLSPAEWYYLLNTRSVAYKRYDHVTVNEKQGLILYPDEFLWPDPAITEDNNYSGDDWTALENAGCVFLIAGGCYSHDGDPVQMDSGNGDYWARLDGQDPAYDNMQSQANQLSNQISNYLRFTSTTVSTHSNAAKQAGHALMVRLVHRAD